ncbi:unnamed protein product [Rhizoctonia solani]|uniref:Uncharacterized protein n=1 Tax=Rhizoctonia solani TaxID=456999 RepID=A0A8H3AX15_9AGAM|nr:unnamed protein product [Rhizoctonia solani]
MSTLTVPSNLTSTHNHHQGWDELPTGAKVLIIIMLCGTFLVLLMALLIATDCTCASPASKHKATSTTKRTINHPPLV